MSLRIETSSPGQWWRRRMGDVYVGNLMKGCRVDHYWVEYIMNIDAWGCARFVYVWRAQTPPHCLHHRSSKPIKFSGE